MEYERKKLSLRIERLEFLLIVMGKVVGEVVWSRGIEIRLVWSVLILNCLLDI